MATKEIDGVDEVGMKAVGPSHVWALLATKTQWRAVYALIDHIRDVINAPLRINDAIVNAIIIIILAPHH
jgi:hypothetical protein